MTVHWSLALLLSIPSPLIDPPMNGSVSGGGPATSPLALLAVGVLVGAVFGLMIGIDLGMKAMVSGFDGIMARLDPWARQSVRNIIDVIWEERHPGRAETSREKKIVGISTKL